MKYLYSLITFLLLSCALHAQTPWSGASTAVTPNGNVYSVSTAEELAWIAEQSHTTDFSGYTIRLTADIDLGGTLEPHQEWQPIGDATHPFNGNFDGNNHVIRNLYISSGIFSSAGLFAETGTAAEIHNLALAQGQIFINGVHDVGSFIGINRGKLHHCFNMAEILANNGDRIGGLVGTNDGEISHSYNTGIITKARDMVGGLVGYNTANAVMNWCYNTGYCKGDVTIGALFGKNEALANKLTDIYFDQQTARMDACGITTTAVDFSLFSVIRTIDMKSKFVDDSLEWVLTSKNSYPKLVCFGNLTAAQLSTYAILLDSKNLPIERADAVGTPKESNSPRKEFNLDCEDNSVRWTSGNDEVIHIRDISKAETKRPCGNQEVYLTVSLGNDVKQIYTHVRGYESFDPGDLLDSNIVVACLKQPGVVLSDYCAGNKPKPTGGKDDEQDNMELSYQYRWIRYAVTTDENNTNASEPIVISANLMSNLFLDANNNYVLVPIDTTRSLSQGEYKKHTLITKEPGLYMFKRYVHDYQCTTTWTESPGCIFVRVLEGFDAGSLYDKVDTIYGLPADTVVLSQQDATGGEGRFHYGWYMRERVVNYFTDEVVSEESYGSMVFAPDPNTGRPVPVTTVTCPVHFTKPGEYIYSREVNEETCSSNYTTSENEHRIVVFDSLRAGSISHIEESLCSPDVTDTIMEIDTVSGGNGVYSYRWLCNGQVIDDCDSTILNLSNFPMTYGHTYVFRRQVKDNTGLMDWTTSKDSVVYTIYAAYKAGSVIADSKHECYGRKDELSLQMKVDQKEAPQGDGGFYYCWLLYRNGEKTPFDTLRYNHANLDTTVLLSSFRGLRLPVSLVARRAVKNTLCPSTWQVSADSAMWSVGYNDVTNKTVTPCTADLPYRNTYKYQDGRTKEYALQDGESVTFDDMTKDGCSLTYTVSCKAYKRPTVEVQPIVSACQTDTALIFSYKVIEGKPNAYDVTFSDNAKAAGFVSIKGATIPDNNEIHVPVPSPAAYDKYDCTILFYTATNNGTAGCVSEEQKLSFSLYMDGFVHRKWNDVVFVDNSDKNCEPNCDKDLTFTAYQWYKDGELIPGATGQSYYEAGGLNGYYQVLMTASDGTIYRSCEYEMRPVIEALDDAQAPVRLYPIPVQSGAPINVNADEDGEIQMYNLQGACSSVVSVHEGRQAITAPAVPGMYLIRFVSENKQVFTRKMIVL